MKALYIELGSFIAWFQLVFQSSTNLEIDMMSLVRIQGFRTHSSCTKCQTCYWHLSSRLTFPLDFKVFLVVMQETRFASGQGLLDDISEDLMLVGPLLIKAGL